MTERNTSELDPERVLRQRFEAGDLKAVATLALKVYGPEIMGFLVVVLRDPDEAGEVFSQFLEALWRGLPRFSWISSLRTWVYALARNAAHHHRRDRQRKRQVPLSLAPEVAQVAENVRTTTLAFLRTQARTRVERLRESLDPDDQMLLILRVNRKLEWKEIARIMDDAGMDAADDDLDRVAARLRKRYQRVLDDLRQRAESG
jgi:RNA polymerase sigma-70 factor (ECF subfamily)